MATFTQVPYHGDDNKITPSPTTTEHHSETHPYHQQIPKISDFTFLTQLASGAFGTVHLATLPRHPNFPYAIKTIQKSSLLRKNLASKLVEERTALLKSHSNPFTVRLHYSLQTDSHVYFILDYCVGGDLKSLLNHMQFFPLPMATFYTASIALALAHLHSKQIIHRDIKPDNVLIDHHGRPKLTDFGLSDLGIKTLSPLNPSTFTPGQLASLGQNLTFSHCGGGDGGGTTPPSNYSPHQTSLGGNNNQIPSPILSSGFTKSLQTRNSQHSSPNANSDSGTTSGTAAADPSNNSSHHFPSTSSLSQSHQKPNPYQPLEHSTPVGLSSSSTASNMFHPVVHTKHRKVRIPLRKLGSRTHLTSNNNFSSSLSLSEHSSSSSSSSLLSGSSWSIISGGELGQQQQSEKENSDGISELEQEDDDSKQQNFAFKRIKLSTQNATTPSKAFNFDSSSFINVTFNFSNSNPSSSPPKNSRCDSDTETPSSTLPKALSLQQNQRSPIVAPLQAQQQHRTPSTPRSRVSSKTTNNGTVMGSSPFSTPNHALSQPTTTDYCKAQNKESTDKEIGLAGSGALFSPFNNNNKHSTHSPLHHCASPETGRFQRTTSSVSTTAQQQQNQQIGAASSCSTAYYYSMPVLQESPPYYLAPPPQSQVLKPLYFNLNHTNNNKEKKKTTDHVAVDSNNSSYYCNGLQPKSPSWPESYSGLLLGTFSNNNNNITNNSGIRNQNGGETSGILGESCSSKKRKRLSEHYSGHRQQRQQSLAKNHVNLNQCHTGGSSTGLTAEFFSIHLPSGNGRGNRSNYAVGTPPPLPTEMQQQHLEPESFRTESPIMNGMIVGTPPAVYSTPIQGQDERETCRLLGTPDYVAPELIRSAMAEVKGKRRVVDDGVWGSSTDPRSDEEEDKEREIHITPAVDWWSLGVCFYEFVIGVLPFNDDSPELIFKNILARDLEYPEGLDPDIICVMDGLMHSEARDRFGIKELKQAVSVFGGEEWWRRLEECDETIVPWVPIVRTPFDTTYFGK